MCVPRGGGQKTLSAFFLFPFSLFPISSFVPHFLVFFSLTNFPGKEENLSGERVEGE